MECLILFMKKKFMSVLEHGVSFTLMHTKKKRLKTNS